MDCPHCHKKITPLLLFEESLVEKCLLELKQKPHGIMVDSTSNVIVVPSTPAPPKPVVVKPEPAPAPPKPAPIPAPAPPKPNSRVIYEEHFKGDPLQMIQTHGYWVFSDGGVHAAHPQRSPQEIAKRFKKVDKGLEIVCLSTDKDYTGSGLNPRAELRVQKYQLPLGRKYKVTIQLHLPRTRNVGAEIFQIMNSNPSKPTLQLEVRKQKFGVRYKDGNPLVVKPLFDEYANKSIRFEVEFVLDVNKGYFKVWKDGEFMWEKGAPTIPIDTTTSWLQYGVYKNGTGNNSQDQSVVFEYFKIEELLS